MFALAYTRMTQTYVWTRELPGYYEDVPFANHQDAVFAKYYTDASGQTGRTATVPRCPKAWLTAFDAARTGAVTGTGDLLLGMNAHINRDLPYVLASVGLVAPDGSSRKVDFDKVEEFLATRHRADDRRGGAALRPLDGRRAATPGRRRTRVFMQVISAWRENAWRNAEAAGQRTDAGGSRAGRGEDRAATRTAPRGRSCWRSGTRRR